MVKADDIVVFDEEHPERFTEFEYLQARVEQMEKVLDAHTDIMRSNRLVEKREVMAPYVDEDDVFKALAGE